MPNCRICKERIDLSITNVRAYTCSECNKIVCESHFDATRFICYNCAGLPAAPGGIAFSFIRKAKKVSKDEVEKR